MNPESEDRPLFLADRSTRAIRAATWLGILAAVVVFWCSAGWFAWRWLGF